MTPRAERLIELLLEVRREGLEFDRADVAARLRSAGLDSGEAGWVLRHVYELRMADAVHLATEVLQVERPTISVEAIQDGVARFFDIKLAEMKGQRRHHQIVLPRQIAMFLVREHTGLSLPEIGRRFGGRDHTTVIHALRKVRTLMDTDPAYCRKVEHVARMIGLPLACGTSGSSAQGRAFPVPGGPFALDQVEDSPLDPGSPPAK